ncbi:MAG: hypothetical protein GF349_04825 [Candidatus Magasanikbacteria bacterium]|nr:hypothetical protein [Candidatus Magasanikbacteria bacterium]
MLAFFAVILISILILVATVAAFVKFKKTDKSNEKKGDIIQMKTWYPDESQNQNTEHENQENNSNSRSTMIGMPYLGE